MMDLSPWDLTPEQKQQLAAEWAEKQAAGDTRPRTCPTQPEAAPVTPEPAMSNDAAAWVADNSWINQQVTKFTRTHFRPFVLRRGRIR